MTGSWLERAGSAVERLGFVLIDGDRPGAPDACHLVIAFRAEPERTHFDPEAATFWVAASGRGQPLVIDRGDDALDRPVLWGHVHVVDRFGIENRFLTFGGHLRSAAAAPATTVVDLASPGPIVRWGGHSQGTDPLAAEVGAFFGRLIIPVEEIPGVEARLGATPPLVLHAAFVRDLDERVTRERRASRATGAVADPLGSWRIAETSRLRAHEPGAWAAAGELLGALRLR
jgi:hypothetical protein